MLEATIDEINIADFEVIDLLVCAAGIRTNYTANAFRFAGYLKVYSLVSGNKVLGERGWQRMSSISCSSCQKIIAAEWPCS